MVASSKISRSSTERGWLSICWQRILEDASAIQIVKGVDVLLALRWLQDAGKEVGNLTVKNCFKKCGIKRDNELMEVKKVDELEFEALVKEFKVEYICCRLHQFWQKCYSVWANDQWIWNRLVTMGQRRQH